MDPLSIAILTLSAAIVSDIGLGDPLEKLLLPPGQYPGVGAETITASENGITRLTSPHGSTRYLWVENGIVVSALQTVSRDGRYATVANVYTAPSHRRNGLAGMLLQQARRDFTEVSHSSDLSSSGEAWVEATETLTAPLGAPDHQFEYWASCPDLTGPIIHYITEARRTRKISYRAFAGRTDLNQMRELGHPAMYRISAPDNWSVQFYRSSLPSGRPIYCFRWSGIEHIFVDPSRGLPSPKKEDALAKALL